MTYQLTTCGAKNLNTGSEFPFADGNADYEAYKAWLAEGNAPQPADAVAAVIPDITPRQIRMALTQSGLRSQVEAAVAAGDQNLKDWWGFTQTFERNHPEVTAMAAALNVTSAQVDAVWQLGATL